MGVVLPGCKKHVFFLSDLFLGHDESQHEIKMYSIDLIVNDSVFEIHAYISRLHCPINNQYT